MIKFLDNKYTKWYMAIINKAKVRASTRVAAKKILICVEGHHVYPKSIIANNDIVYLSIKEHFVCHWLLTKMTTGADLTKMRHAMTFFTKRDTLTPFEVKVYMSFKHTPCSDTRRLNIATARHNTVKQTCPHCNKQCDGGNYKRFHGERCKHNPNVDPSVWEALSIKNKQSTLKSIANGNHKHRSPNSYGTIICPHCGVTGINMPNMKRNHFDRCSSLTSSASHADSLIESI